MSILNKSTSLRQIFDHQCDAHKDKIAYRFICQKNGESTLTYEQLYHRVNQLANYISAYVEPGDRVLLAAQPGLDFIVSFYACVRLGAVAVPVFPPANQVMAHRLLTITNDSEPKLVLVNQEIYRKFKLVRFANKFAPSRVKSYLKISDVISDFDDAMRSKNIPLLSISGSANSSKDFTPIHEYMGSDTVFLQYTSGSISDPKGVIISNDNLLDNIRLMRVKYNFDRCDSAFSWLPPYHDMGLIGLILLPCCLGMTATHISPIDFIKNPPLWVKYMSKYKCDLTAAPNFGYELCARKIDFKKYKNIDLSHLLVAVNGAEPILSQTINDFYNTFRAYGLKKGALYPSYGMAESTLLISAKDAFSKMKFLSVNREKLKDGVVIEEDGVNASVMVSCGPSVLDIKIVDPNSELELGDAIVGEIWVTGTSVSKGYFNRDKLSKQSFENYLANDDKPYFKTGDLGFIFDGELYICSRIKDLIIHNGKNYYPQDIEMHVTQTSNIIRNGCVIAYEDLGQIPQSISIVAELTSSIDKVAMANTAKMISKKVAQEFALPVANIYLIKSRSIPKTTSGKLQRSKCRELINSNSLPVLFHYDIAIDSDDKSREVEPSQIADDELLSVSNDNDNLLDIINIKSETERSILLTKKLQSMVKEALSLQTDPPIDKGFFELGMDSVQALQFKDQLQTALGDEIQLDDTVAFELPTISDLRDYLISHLTTPKSERKQSTDDIDFDNNILDKEVSELSQEDKLALVKMFNEKNKHNE